VSRRILPATGATGALALAAATIALGSSSSPVTAGPVSAITSSSATLSGTIDPSGFAESGGVSYRFEYGTSTHYAMATATASTGTASAPVEVQAAITGLKPGARYHWRLAATFGIETLDKYGRIFTTEGGSTPKPPQPTPLPPGLSPVRVPGPGAARSWLRSIACPSASKCIAIGGRSRGRLSGGTLAETWNGGSWRVVPTRGLPGNVSLEGLACPGARSCLAVGGGLVARWNGHGWRRAPARGLAGAYLSALDCVSSGDCWASGEVNGGTPQEAAILARWNGRSWSVHHVPRGSNTILESVSCLSSRDCWTAGTKFVNRVHQPWTAYHWNGRRWAKAKLPSSGRYVGELSVSCRTASTCWAFGVESRAKPAALRLRGGRWRRVPTALPPLAKPPYGELFHTVRGDFRGLACIARRDCWAVGEVTIDNEEEKALVEHWTGGAWSVASAGYPVPIHLPRGRVGAGYAQTQLGSVACPTAETCVAVGETIFENRKGLIVRSRPLSETSAPRAAG
jgi:hypothetical protein